jgi:peptidyl-prolyl cis-trans isomerase SDCCAG10
MSAIYNLEPQPTASAILHTSLGEISIELFAKQTPLTCRNFLQLALDGYYDNTIFHRLVPNFILQGGDPTGTGNGGESIYDGGAFGGDLDPWPMDQRQGKNAGPTGVNFKDEFHSRLKFNRRGLLAMANEGRPDTNGSQFFFTLDKTEELNGKNTLFGRVAGDTIYNLAKLGELDVDPTTERPLYPVKLLRVEILVNPFEGMEKRTRIAAQAPSVPQQDKQKKKRKKGGKQLLSFGDEEGDEPEPIIKKAKFDTRIVMVDDNEEQATTDKLPKPKAKKREPPSDVKPEKVLSPEDGAAQEHKESTTSKHVERPSMQPRKREQASGPESDADDQAQPREKSALEKANAEIAALKASLRRTVHSEPSVPEKPKSALESMIPETSMRGRKRRPGGNNTSASEDQKTLRMLKDFQSRLEIAVPEIAPASKDKGSSTQHADKQGGGNMGGDDEAELCDLHFIANCQSCTAWGKQDKEESDDEGWMSHSLSFAAEKIGKDLSNRRKAEEELVVIDPREKARNMKEEKRTKREPRAWDQRRDQLRNAELARAASVAGRGAK